MTRLSHVGLLVAAAVAVTAVVGLRAAAEDPPSPTEKRLAAVEQQLKALALERDSRFESQQLEVAFLERQSPPIGTVVAFAGEWTTGMEETTGWMLCDGREVDRSMESGRYRDLLAAIGSAHGWNAATGKFRIPDYRGMFLRGVQGGRDHDKEPWTDPEPKGRFASHPGGNDKNAVGSLQGWSTGNPIAGFTALLNGNHSHDVNLEIGASRNPNGGMGNTAASPSLGGPKPQAETGGAHTHDIGGGDVETRPVNSYVHWLIKFRAGSAPR